MQRSDLDYLFFFLASLSLLGAWIIDVILPEKIIVASLYVVPILIASYRFKEKTIVFFTVLSAMVFAFQANAEAHHIITIILHVMAMSVVAALAIKLNQQTVKSQRLKKNVEAVNHQLEVFINMVAHDLAQPVTAAKLYGEMLVKATKGKENNLSKKLVNSIRASEYFIADLREAGRIGRGQFVLDPEKTNLCDLIKEVIAEEQMTTSKHRIVYSSPKNLTGNWDKKRLKQVFANLLSNAIKYSPEGGTVKVILQKAENSVLVSVSDIGLGMSNQEQRLLFRPFIRQYKGKIKINGIGLGLYISKTIVEAHRGKIWVKSQKGKGTTFYVDLPYNRSGSD